MIDKKLSRLRRAAKTRATIARDCHNGSFSAEVIADGSTLRAGLP